MNRFAITAGLALALVIAPPAAAQQFDSAYTEMDLAACTLLSTDEMGGSWACPGYKGYPVWVAEGDLRFFVSYGFGAPGEPAASQTLRPFNELGPRIEWRLRSEGGTWVPFATILRFLTEPEPGYRGQALVVTRLGPDGVCQVARIDARANPDANQLARDAADSIAPLFACGQEPLVLGAPGRSF